MPPRPAGPLVGAALLFIRVYRALAPARVRRSCRFQPTCSEFARQALLEHGFRAGLRATWLRLLRCRPPHGGLDPVPLRGSPER